MNEQVLPIWVDSSRQINIQWEMANANNNFLVSWIMLDKSGNWQENGRFFNVNNDGNSGTFSFPTGEGYLISFSVADVLGNNARGEVTVNAWIETRPGRAGGIRIDLIRGTVYRLSPLAYPWMPYNDTQAVQPGVLNKTEPSPGGGVNFNFAITEPGPVRIHSLQFDYTEAAGSAVQLSVQFNRPATGDFYFYGSPNDIPASSTTNVNFVYGAGNLEGLNNGHLICPLPDVYLFENDEITIFFGSASGADSSTQLLYQLRNISV